MKMITGVALLALLFVVPAAMAQTDDVGQDDTGRVAAASVNQKTFHLVAQPKFLACLQASPNKTPKATVTVVRGELHDSLTLTIKNIKPHLNFDLFTIENTNLLANGTLTPTLSISDSLGTKPTFMPISRGPDNSQLKRF